MRNQTHRSADGADAGSLRGRRSPLRALRAILRAAGRVVACKAHEPTVRKNCKMVFMVHTEVAVLARGGLLRVLELASGAVQADGGALLRTVRAQRTKSPKSISLTTRD